MQRKSNKKQNNKMKFKNEILMSLTNQMNIHYVRQNLLISL
jgi:hypothetical protein